MKERETLAIIKTSSGLTGDGIYVFSDVVCDNCGHLIGDLTVELKIKDVTEDSERARLLPWTVKRFFKAFFNVNPKVCPECHKRIDGLLLSFDKDNESNEKIEGAIYEDN